MSPFGGKTNKYRLVPRASGDTAPLDPSIVEALRKAGMDPTRFTLAPLEPGEADALASPLFRTGARVEHAFAFETLNAALSAIERLIDDELEPGSARRIRSGSSSLTYRTTQTLPPATRIKLSRSASRTSVRRTEASPISP